MATQTFPVPSIPFISIESPLRVETIESPFYQNPDFWIGSVGVLISICLSVISLVYSRKLAKEARDESVNDIFWFREVVYPRSIKPLLDVLDSFSNKIPIASTPKRNRKSLTDKCLSEWHILRAELNYQLTYLGLWNGDIYQNVTDSLDQIEDAITNYCFSLKTDSTSTSNEYTSCVQLLIKLQIYMFNDVQKAHLGK